MKKLQNTETCMHTPRHYLTFDHGSRQIRCDIKGSIPVSLEPKLIILFNLKATTPHFGFLLGSWIVTVKICRARDIGSKTCGTDRTSSHYSCACAKGHARIHFSRALGKNQECDKEGGSVSQRHSGFNLRLGLQTSVRTGRHIQVRHFKPFKGTRLATSP